MSNEKDMTQDMGSRMIIENNIFPRWEQIIPTLGIKHSSPSEAAARRLVVTLLLMMVLGVIGVKAQTVDYSGTYYIASGDNRGGNNISDIHYNSETPGDNYYLCPTDEENWICYVDPDNYTNPQSDNDQPFLTTYKYRATADATPAIWIFEKVLGTEYYHIIHKNTYRYLTYNGKISTTSGRGVNRLRFHLQATATNNSLFQIVQDDDVPAAVNIIAVAAIDTYMYDNQNAKYLNLSSPDDNSLVGSTGKTDGPTNCKNVGATIGIWYDVGRSSEWFLEEIVPRPTITNTDSEITFSHSEEEATIYYTTDGTNPNPTTTNFEGTGTAPLQIDMPENTVTIKAIATIDNLPSCISKIRVVPTASITLSSSTYTYTGSAITPEVSSVKDGETTIDPNEYTVTYSNNINAGMATVTITDSEGGDYIVYGSTTFTINPVEVTLTANSGTEAYDGTEKTVNGFTSSVDGLTFEGVTASGSGTNAGEYDVTFTGVTIDMTKDTSGNYMVTGTTNGTLTVTARPVTVTADSDTKVYDGTPLTKPTATASGLVDGHTLASVTVTGSQTAVGSSDNIPSDAVIKNGDEVVTANYNITYVNGTLSVTKRILTITAGSDTKVYDGTALTKNSYTNEGLMEGDNVTSVTITGSQTAAGTSNNVPSAAVVKRDETDVTDNYTINYVNGTLTVTPKTVKDDPDTEAGESAVSIVLTDIPVGNFTYDGTAKTPTVTVKDGETVIALSEYTLGLSDNTNAGTATVTITDNEGGNYNVSGATTFTINPAALTITPDNGQGKQFGDPDPALTYTNVGLVEGDVLAGALARAEGENAGTYAINQGTLDNSHNPNYAITFTTGKTFAITPKSLGSGTDPAENITIEITEADADHVVVKQSGNPLRAGTAGTEYDYSISTEGNATTKYYKVTVTGANNYKGSFKATFANVAFGTNDNNHYWGTFVSDNNDGNFAVPSNFSAYIVTDINASVGTVVLEGPLDNIPEQVPVLLLSAVDAKGFMVNTKNDGNDPTGTNLLKVEDTAKEVAAAEIYLLYNGEFVLNAAGTLPAGKVYLTKSSGSAAPARLHIVRSQSTGIDNPQLSTLSTQLSTLSTQLSGIWYTLDGRRLTGKPTKKGLYLQNGKKMVVR